jgi:putative inorganic carbon (hco3(-)) transporter
VAVAVGVAALAVVSGLAAAMARRPQLFALLVVVALPFRIPIQAAGITSNLLVPLYVVVGAGALAFIVRSARARGLPKTELVSVAGGSARALGGQVWMRWLIRLLALNVGLYAVQSLYSPDFEKALQQMVFFYVPFALMFCILRQMEWTPRLLRDCLVVAAVLALAFAGVGFAEYATKTLLLNPKLIAANDVHTYFTVNSVFFDPDIFGRFLALVMVLVAGALLYGRSRGEQLAALAALAVLWGGLVLTLSRSSLGALLLGLGVLGALRWRAKPILAAAAAVVVVGIAAVAISPKTFGLNQGLNGASSGRAGLVSGGAQLFAHRPVWGYGSGSFQVRYRALNPKSTSTLSASHTIAITIAAEQGLIGELPYIALVVVAAVVLLAGVRASPYRAAIGAAFLALMFHTELYADFLEDPLTWTLLGAGLALARGARGAAAVGKAAAADAVTV